MAQKKHKPEEIIAKLRQVDVLVSQGRPVAEAIRTIGVTAFTYYRWRKEFGDLQGAEHLVEGREAEVLGAADPDPHLGHVLAMENHQIAEAFRVTRLARNGGFLSIDAALHVERPFLGILPAQERFAEVLPLSTDLGSPGAGF